jgi:c-di-GMP-binding flagellar brake protein YcgR
MPNPDANAASDAPPSDEKYVSASQLEIVGILNAIMRQSTKVTTSADGGEPFVTSIVAIDEEPGQLLLEFAPSLKLNQALLPSQLLLCSTRLDKISIKFECEYIEATRHEGRAAIRVEMPTKLLRLQRREAYRMPAPPAAPVKCSIATVRKGKPVTVEVSLFDISAGGVGLITPPDLFMPEIGKTYACTLQLPGIGALQARIQARSGFATTLPDGKVTQRSGFAFVDLPGKMLATIQRYIMNLERERNARGGVG